MDLQAEYDNGAKVPGYPAIAARWAEKAAAFRATHLNSEQDVAYGPTERQALDLFWPDVGRNVPVVIFIHGGYWQRAHRNIFSHLSQGLLAHGIGVAMPSYDLCPNVKLSEIVEQVRDSAVFLHRRLGQRFVVTGHSAGGHLAAMLLTADWHKRGAPVDLVPAAVPISGLFDLTPLIQTTINTALGLNEAEARRLSPLFAPRPRGRIHAFVGGTEGAEYERQSRSISEAWQGTWQSISGRHHFNIVEDLRNPHSVIVAKILSLVPDF